jgi:hypothetical protein
MNEKKEFKKLTTRDLVGNLIGLEMDKEYLELRDNNILEADIAEVDQSIADVKQQIAKKAEGIDYFMVEMKRNADIIDAEIKSYNDEIKRLRQRKNAISRTEDYFNKELLPMIIQTAGNDGKFETKTSKYTLYETYGPLIVTDEELVPTKYKKATISIDKKGARKDVIDAAEDGIGIAGFDIGKVKRIRRS